MSKTKDEIDSKEKEAVEYAPIVQYQEGGKAAILNYNIPEPTSYSGRNFIDLKFPDGDYFKEISGPPKKERILIKPKDADQEVSENNVIEAMKNGFHDSRFFINNMTINGIVRFTQKTQKPDSQSEVVSNRIVSPELATLDPDMVLAAIKAGKKLAIYQTLDGSLTFKFVDPLIDDKFIRLNETMMMLPDGRPPIWDVFISSPRGNSVIVLQPGAKLEVRGGVVDDNNVVRSVGVKIDEGDFREATPLAGSWEDWVFADIVSPGLHKIIAEARTGGPQPKKKSATVANVTVSFESPPDPDGVPPTIEIISPIAGSEQVGTEEAGALVKISGTAGDNRGVKEVLVKVDEQAFVSAKNDSTNWSVWSKDELIKTSGTKRITAKAIDTSNNERETIIDIPVRIEKADRIKPEISINSPFNGAVMQGLGSTGIVVSVIGTAKDDHPGSTGIADVKVKIGINEEKSATPLLGGDWSQGWTYGDLILTEGPQSIVAKAIDNAGNTNQASVNITIAFVETNIRGPHLMLVEVYRLSSYLGNYGAGRTIKTLTLLPGEKTKISVKTFTSRENKAVQASSILDSLTSQSSDSFQNEIGREQSDKEGFNMSSQYEVHANAKATWGWGSAEIGGGIKEGTNSSREEFAKNVSNTTKKHVMEASAKRDLKVEASYEVKEERREETVFEQEIQNINLGRTLNFVFRQMNQEFLTFIHLVDIRLLYINVNSNSPENWVFREVTLPEMDSLLKQFIKDEKRTEVRNLIIAELESIKDYNSEQPHLHKFIKKVISRVPPTVPPTEPKKKAETEPKKKAETEVAQEEPTDYYYVNQTYVQDYIDPTLPDPYLPAGLKIPGVIRTKNTYVLRTQGIIVEALLGVGDALDPYSKTLQTESNTSKILNNELMKLEIKKGDAAIKLVEDGNTAGSEIFAKVFPCCVEEKEKEKPTTRQKES